MHKKFASSLAALLFSSVAVAAYAGPITAASLTTNGQIRFDGLGADGTGRGTGYYTVGNCSNNGVTTTCIMTGTYTELTGTNPGAVGNFTLTTTYAGTSVHAPSIVRSSVANPNSVGYVDSNLNGALMTLALMPSYGGLFSATLPPFPPTGLGFNGIAAPGMVCSGAALTIQLASQPGCNIGNVLLNNGAIGIGAWAQNGVTFTLPVGTPNTAPVPEPGTIALLGTGLAFVAARIRRRV